MHAFRLLAPCSQQWTLTDPSTATPRAHTCNVAGCLPGGLKVEVWCSKVWLQQFHSLVVDLLLGEVEQGTQETRVAHHLHGNLIGSTNHHGSFDVLPRYLHWQGGIGAHGTCIKLINQSKLEPMHDDETLPNMAFLVSTLKHDFTPQPLMNMGSVRTKRSPQSTP